MEKVLKFLNRKCSLKGQCHNTFDPYFFTFLCFDFGKIFASVLDTADSKKVSVIFQRIFFNFKKQLYKNFNTVFAWLKFNCIIFRKSKSSGLWKYCSAIFKFLKIMLSQQCPWHRGIFMTPPSQISFFMTSDSF